MRLGRPATAAAASIRLGGAANAATVTIDFNSHTPGTDITGIDLGCASITQDGNTLYAVEWLEVGPDTMILGVNSTSAGYRADFDEIAASVSLDLGDRNADADDIYLEAYDSPDNLVAFGTAYLDPAFIGLETLSVSGSNISHVVFGGYGFSDDMSVHAGNLIFETAASVVPLPAGGALLIGALGALGLARRKRSA